MSSSTDRLRRMVALMLQRRQLCENEVSRAQAEHARIVADRAAVEVCLQSDGMPLMAAFALRRISILEQSAAQSARHVDTLLAKLARMDRRCEHLVEQQRGAAIDEQRADAVRTLTEWFALADASADGDARSDD